MVSVTNKQKAINLLRKVSTNKTQNGSCPNQIESVGTIRNYRDCIKMYLDWCAINLVPNNLLGGKLSLIHYLEEKSEIYQQKTLDQHRMALNLSYHKKLPFVKSLLDTVLSARDYRFSEVMLLIKNLNSRNAVAILICFFSGLRAHELATIERLDEGSLSTARLWSNQLFSFEENFIIYLVTGKGGLCRQVAIPINLAIIIESRRLIRPIRVRDREIYYLMNYDLGYGKALSQCFSRASLKYLSWSTGLHGLRHSYAKNRIKKILVNGFNLENAKLVVSQELGHFRPEIVNCYLR